MTSLSTPAHVEQALEQLHRLYRALADLRDRVAPVNPRTFALLAEGPLDHIRELLAELEAHAATASFATERLLWMRVEGRQIQWPNAPTSVLSGLLEILRKGVQSVAEFASRGAWVTRPTEVLRRACDLRVVALAPGSLRVALAPPDGVEGADVAAQALETYLATAQWAASADPEASLEREVPDQGLRRLALNEVARLVPRKRGDVECIELSGSVLGLRPPVLLRRQTRERIGQAVVRLAQAEARTYAGTLREIDLDKRTFILRNSDDVAEIPCGFAADLLGAAKEALDKRIEVTGTTIVAEETRRGAPRLMVTRIEILDDEPPFSPDSTD